ncbi:unnamed protein product [Ectocarpus sp. 8 AP-2014]
MVRLGLMWERHGRGGLLQSNVTTCSIEDLRKWCSVRNHNDGECEPTKRRLLGASDNGFYLGLRVPLPHLLKYWRIVVWEVKYWSIAVWEGTTVAVSIPFSDNSVYARNFASRKLLLRGGNDAISHYDA